MESSQIIFDKVSGIFENYSRNNLSSIWEEADKERPNLLTKRAGTSDGYDDPKAVRTDNANLQVRIGKIARRHNLFELLLLTRKIPSTLLPYLLTGGTTVPWLAKRSQHLVFEKACLFSTNCELVYCPNELNVQAVNERNHIEPSAELMRDAIRIMIFASWHALNSFYLNTAARRPAADPQHVSKLIDLYNDRQDLGQTVKGSELREFSASLHD